MFLKYVLGSDKQESLMKRLIPGGGKKKEDTHWYLEFDIFFYNNFCGSTDKIR